MMHPKRIEPGPGQESVWDYPRPPRLEKSDANIRVIVDDRTIAESSRAYRVLETSHPPVYYLPLDDVDSTCLHRCAGSSFCEWKGAACYFAIEIGERRIEQAAWSYRTPTKLFKSITDYIAFYPSRVDACYVNDERVEAQAGDFYGGWITSEIVGPFKGAPGTMGW